MRGKLLRRLMFAILLFCQFSICLATETSDPNDSSKYLDAVREFADNVLKYGRDIYGPKHTPLFVDGLNIHTHEPVKWISPEGERWILSNLASQQNLFRTLDGLTKITGDPKYRQAAVESIKYAFANLRHTNGLFYWGHTTAYDAGADDIRCGAIIGRDGSHAFKLDYPYYELMWEVNSKETKRFIEAFWSAHIIDWSNLDFERYALFRDALEDPWNHEYKRYPTFFKSKKDSVGGTWTGTSLIHAGTTLYRLSGEKQPLIWSKRLAERFIDTRHPKTGITYGGWTYHTPYLLGDDFKEHFNDPRTRTFPGESFSINLNLYYGENVTTYNWMSMLLVGEMLGEEGKDFKRWALEEFTAMGKASYRKKDNSFVPILTDGTSMEGYVWKEAPGTGSEGLVVKPCPADMSFFWGYSVAYHITGDEFMWEMVRDITCGNDFGEVGQTPEGTPKLQTDTACSHVYALLGFLELYAKTKKLTYLEMARRIGDNILLNQFHKGFFVPSKRHIYTRFDWSEPLALLHLDAAMKNKTGLVPRVWPSVPLFVPPYRYKGKGNDRLMIYTLTESSEPPLSLQEAATIGDVNLVRTLIENGTDVDSVEDTFLHTALHRATIRGHKDVVETLIAEGAYVNSRTPGCTTPLHDAARIGRMGIAELLIAKGADVNAKKASGDTPLHSATRTGHKDIVELLTAQGADVNAKNSDGQTPVDVAVQRGRKEIAKLLLSKGCDVSLHTAAYFGDLQRVEELIDDGVHVDAKDQRDQTAMHYAAKAGQIAVAELLIANGADVNAGKWTPLQEAAYYSKEIVELLLAKGANINTGEWTALHSALDAERFDIVELLLAKGADTNIRDNNGRTPLHIAARYAASKNPKIVELLLSKGADINAKDNNDKTALAYATENGHTEIVSLLRKHGANQ